MSAIAAVEHAPLAAMPGLLAMGAAAVKADAADNPGSAQQQATLQALIGERDALLAALRQQAEVLQIAGRLARVGGWVADLASCSLVWSPEAAAIHGLPLAPLTFDEARGCYAPECRERLASLFRRCAKEGLPFDEEFELVTAQGQRVAVRCIAQAERDAHGRIRRIQGALQDISERREAELNLRASEQQHRAMAERLTATLENITDGHFKLDAQWCFSDINTEALRLFGRTREEMLGRSAWAVFPAEQGSVFHDQYRLAMAERRSVAFEAQSVQLKRWFEVRAYPADDGLAVYFRDVSERHAAMQALRISEQRFKHVAQITADSVWDWDLVTGLVWRNEGFCRLFGYEPGEIETGIASWTRRIHPDELPRVAQGIQAVIEGKADNWTDEFRFRRKDGSYAHVVDRGRVIRNEAGQAVRMIGGMSDLSERHAAADAALQARQRFDQALQASEAQYRLLFDHNPQPMWVVDSTTHHFLAVNQRAIAHYGYSRAEFLALRVEDLWLPQDGHRVSAVIGGTGLGQRTRPAVRRHRRKDGSVIDAEVSSDPIVFNGREARLALANDVSERLRAERELARLNRAQRMLGACNEALIRADDEQSLLEQICRLSVDIGGYGMTWVGFMEDDAACSVRPLAHAGDEGGYLQGLPLSWSADTPAGRGAIGRAITTGEVVVIENVETDPSVALWRERALQHGFRAWVTLPLHDRARDRCFGVLVLYSAEPNPIGPQEKALLQELANDLAFGITNLRALDERRRLQSAVLTVAAAVSSQSGAAFFEQLVQHMVAAVGAQAGFVARLDPQDTSSAQALCGVVDGVSTGPFRYDMAGTPCEDLLQNGSCIVQDNLAQRFPHARTLNRNRAQSLVGCRLNGSDGQPLGLLFVWFRSPLQHSDFVASTLQIFAARAAAELERQQSDARLRDLASLLDKAQDAIIVHGIDNRVSYWNHSAERLYGWRSDEAVGQSIRSLLYTASADGDTEARDGGEGSHGASSAEDALSRACATLLTAGEWTGEIEQRRRDGSGITVEGRWTVVRDEAGQPQSILSINTDISQRKEAERAMHRLAFYDPLTGLPNRQLLSDRLEQALSASARTGRRGALLFIDLDNFKTLNDTLGHDKGDLLLQQVARRLAGCVREMDTVARFGGDEFLVMLLELGEQPEAAVHCTREVAHKILDTLSQPYLLDGHEHRCTPSIGIAPFLGHQHSAGELLKQTDLAMYEAKAAGRNALRFFDPAMQAAVSRRASLEADLRQGLAQQEFILHYQPQADRHGRIIGVEALLRWQHPQHGMVSPAEFIPLAEDTGLILPLGQWVLETACKLLADWSRQSGVDELSISVNVSPRQFHHLDFVDQVMDALRRTGAPANRLKLELTESLLVDDMESIIGKMELLKSLGVGFSLDDFGTGYSSLAYLKRLPLDQLKIDQSFVRDVLTDPNDAAIARTIIALGQSLGQNVIAEGVETIEQRDLLLQQGCHAYQGYYLSRPLPLDQLMAWLG